MTRHEHNPVPWMPEQPFFQDNAPALTDLFGKIADRYPQTKEALQFDPANGLPDDEKRRAMWQYFMGVQHGAQGGGSKKLVIPAEEAPHWYSYLEPLRYGEHPLIHESPATDQSYDFGFELGGTPLENHSRQEGMPANVQNRVQLGGQRLRGLFGEDMPGEGSPADALFVIAQATGADLGKLIEDSPWVRSELAKDPEHRNPWERPFATEHDLMRLGGEAALRHIIDWKHYDDTVEVVEDPNAEPLEYTDESGATQVVPARTHALVRYDLLNGQRLHSINSPAVARAQGVPRPTSTSTAEAALTSLDMPAESRIITVSNAPHIRAAVDVAITFLSARHNQISLADIAAGPWVHAVTKSPVAALGEIMALAKADARLRAVAAGQDPNAPHLQSI